METKILTIYTYDEYSQRIEFKTTQDKALISGLIKSAIEYDVNIEQIELNANNLHNTTNSRNKYILAYINDYFDLCNSEILPEIPAPCIYPNKQNPDLRTSTHIDEKTKAVSNIWADYIDKVVLNCPKNITQLYNTHDLFCLLHTANYMDLKHLVSLCAVKISSYMALCQWSDNKLENVPKNFKRALDGLPIILD